MAVTKDRRSRGNSLWLDRTIFWHLMMQHDAKLLFPVFPLKTCNVSVKCNLWQYIDLYISVNISIYENMHHLGTPARDFKVTKNI